MSRVYVPCCAGPVVGSGATGGGGSSPGDRPEWMTYTHGYGSGLTVIQYAPFYGLGESSSPTDRFVRMAFNGIYTLQFVMLNCSANPTANITVGLHVNGSAVPTSTVTESVPEDAPVLFDFSALSNASVPGQWVSIGVTPATNRASYFLTSNWRRA